MHTSRKAQGHPVLMNTAANAQYMNRIVLGKTVHNIKVLCLNHGTCMTDKAGYPGKPWPDRGSNRVNNSLRRNIFHNCTKKVDFYALAAQRLCQINSITLSSAIA